MSYHRLQHVQRHPRSWKGTILLCAACWYWLQHHCNVEVEPHSISSLLGAHMVGVHSQGYHQMPMLWSVVCEHGALVIESILILHGEEGPHITFKLIWNHVLESREILEHCLTGWHKLHHQSSFNDGKWCANASKSWSCACLVTCTFLEFRAFDLHSEGLVQNLSICLESFICLCSLELIVPTRWKLCFYLGLT